MARKKDISIFISFLLRHKPETVHLEMDRHGWVAVKDLIDGINQYSAYEIDMAKLEEIVKTDEKGRYRFNEERTKIKACQGHSIPWVEPQLQYTDPPEFLYHGTNAAAAEKIKQSGAIDKMSRHAVHMQADITKAWQSAKRWGLPPVVLKIDAGRMCKEGYAFGVSDNGVWCTETVPTSYIAEWIFGKN